MKKILTIVFALMISCIIASPIKSNIAARNIEQINEEKASYTASDYVQDGLVSLWDGIENIDWNLHDSSLNICYDLISGNFLHGDSDGNAFIVKESRYLNNINTSNDMTIEWVWRDSGADRISRLFTANLRNQLRYQVNDVRVGYEVYQIRYWNGTEQNSVYPMRKIVRSGSISYGDGIFKVYSNGDLVDIYNDAVASESTRFLIGDNSAFNSIRVYSRKLTDEEISHNHDIDKERFGL